MTRCEVCHEREAVVHLTESQGDQSRTLHLCSRCAAERGIAGEAEAGGLGTPLTAFLSAMGGGGLLLTSSDATPIHCPACDATLNDFRASGRLGCPACWVTFERHLRELLRRVHGATQHVGEGPPSADDPGLPGGASVAQQRLRIQAGLAAAVAAERFEDAAAYRDRLRALEAEGPDV